jgi:hypothetical protein
VAAGNISLVPNLDSSYRPSASTPTDVGTGGIDGSAAGWGFSTDKDGKARIGSSGTGWTMGCYQK